MRTEKEIREQILLNQQKIFPKGSELFKEAYIKALEWVLE